MSTEAQLKAISNSELASGNQIPALKHRTVNNAIIEEMYDAQSRANVLAGVQTAVSIASGDQVLVIRSGQAYLLDSSEFGFVDALADLTDVSIPTPANDQVLAYNTATSKWVAKDVNTLTSVVSISGTATTNALTKFTGTSSIGNSNIVDDGLTIAITGNLAVNTNDLYINSTNGRVGIGTASPATNFEVSGNILADFIATTGNSYTKIFSMDQDIQTTDSVEFLTVTAGSFITTGGTSSQFVKGNGTLDSTDYQDTSEKDQANGYAPLDSGAKIPLANLPDSILGQVSYQGTWAASTNTPTLANPPASTTKGEYYVASDDGTQFGIEFKTGDWIISNGSAWEKVDNTDAVTSVFGRLGNVVANAGDYDAFYVNLDGDQTITGEKTFSGDSLLIANAGNGLKGRFKNTSINSIQDSGYATFGFNGSNNLFFTKATSANLNGGVFAWDNDDAIRTYTLQDASGTLAFTSDLDDYVTLSTAQTITGQKTFNNNTLQLEERGSSQKTVLNNSSINSGSYTLAINRLGFNASNNLYFSKGGNNNGIFAFNNAASRTYTLQDASGTLAFTSDINDTLDSVTDRGATTTNAITVGGATINGNLTVDTDTFFVDASSNRVGIGTTSPSGTDWNASSQLLHLYQNSVNGSLLKLESSNASGIVSVGNNLMYIGTTTDDPLTFYTNTTERMRITSSGNVGIGTTSPGAKLEVIGRTIMTDSGQVPLILNNTGQRFTQLDIRHNGAQKASIWLDNTDSSLNMYTNTGVDLAFLTGGPNERMRIDSSGNVGIGTTSPASGLVPGLVIGNGTDNKGITLWGSTTAQQNIAFTDTANNQQGLLQYDHNTNAMRLFTSSSERMRIDSSGNVDIGATGGATRLSVAGSLGTTNGSASAPTHTFYSDSNTGMYRPSADHLGFSTNGTERMRIDSSGNVGIGTSSPSYRLHAKASVAGRVAEIENTRNNSSGDFGLVLKLGSNTSNTNSYFLIATSDTADKFYVFGNGDVANSNNSYGAISDIKLKENIEDASPKLEDLMQVKVRNYNLIGDDRKQIGVVAQELEEVFPSMIDESPDFEEQEVIDQEGNVTKERVDLGTTTKSVKYSVFVPMLIKAMQEQQEIINDMKAEIETLKQQINGQ